VRNGLKPEDRLAAIHAGESSSLTVELHNLQTARELASERRSAQGGKSLPLEIPSYLDTPDGQIYSVLHASQAERRGTLLTCGPFGAERERAYLSMVRWARTLACDGFDALRFDYRGIGESSGRFREMNLASWRDDAERCAMGLYESAPEVPLILHGVRLGCLVAAELFASGIGDGLLLWAPPSCAREHLRDTLRHNLISQLLNEPDAPRRTREEQIAALEAGEPLNVDGYAWTAGLWNDAAKHPLVVPAAGDRRPWHALHGRSSAASALENLTPSRTEMVDAEDFWGTSSMLLVPRVDGYFQASRRWLGESGLWDPRIA